MPLQYHKLLLRKKNCPKKSKVGNPNGLILHYYAEKRAVLYIVMKTNIRIDSNYITLMHLSSDHLPVFYVIGIQGFGPLNYIRCTDWNKFKVITEAIEDNPIIILIPSVILFKHIERLLLQERPLRVKHAYLRK
jgi:hypothetical protein